MQSEKMNARTTSAKFLLFTRLCMLETKPATCFQQRQKLKPSKNEKMFGTFAVRRQKLEKARWKKKNAYCDTVQSVFFKTANVHNVDVVEPFLSVEAAEYI